jgi:hypothetical protein
MRQVMRRDIAHASKSVVAGLATFVATSALIVTFAVNKANPPREAAARSDAPAAPAAPAASIEPEPTANAGVGTQAGPSDEPVSVDGDDAGTELSGSSEGSPGIGLDLNTATTGLDDSLVSLLGGDVPPALEELLPPAKDLPSLEIIK